MSAKSQISLNSKLLLKLMNQIKARTGIFYLTTVAETNFFSHFSRAEIRSDANLEIFLWVIYPQHTLR